MSGKKAIREITASAVLTRNPGDLFVNQSGVIAEHARNSVLYFLAHLKSLICNELHHGHPEELTDTISKMLGMHYIDVVPLIHGGWFPIGNGVWEFPHPRRMRIPPNITVKGLPDEYSYEVVQKNEVFTRILFKDVATGSPVDHAIPISITFDAEL